MWFLDHLKVLLTALVVLQHAAVTYGAPGGWYYHEFKSGQLALPELLVLVAFVVVNQAYFMGLFYMISGYFTPGSVDRKGGAVFLKDRLMRFGVPMLAYAFLLVPILQYALFAAAGTSPRSAAEWIAFLAREFTRFEIGPLWFTELLFFFSAVYVLGRIAAGRRGGSPRSAPGFPGYRAAVAFAVCIGAVNFLIRLGFPIGAPFAPLNIQLAFLFQYVCLFAVGAAAYRGDWLSRISVGAGKAWARATAGLIALLPVLFLISAGPDGDFSSAVGGWHWQAFVYAVWEQLTGMGMIITLLVFFRERMNYPSPLWKTLSEHSYAVYIVHPLILILVSLSVRQISLSPLMKFLLVGPAAVALSYLAAWAIRKLPGAKAVL
jgi:fucose 4-O-acetylase-like acetyltransferase